MTAPAMTEQVFSASRGCLVQIGSALPDSFKQSLKDRVQVRASATQLALEAAIPRLTGWLVCRLRGLKLSTRDLSPQKRHLRRLFRVVQLQKVQVCAIPDNFSFL